MENRIRCYIINLPSCIERRIHMENITKELKNFIEIEWITGIDGNILDNNQISKDFDLKKYNKYYLWKIRKGEIGCVLSHRLCYKKLIHSKNNYALISEDDINSMKEIKEYYLLFDNLMNSDVPRILLLSGWFWYYKKKKINENIDLCRIFDARFAHSYIINKSAAKLILQEKPWYIADDWRKIHHKKNIEVYGLSPHLINATTEISKISNICNGNPGLYSFRMKAWIKIKKDGMIRRFLSLIGKFESKY